jgi:DNA-binding NtrC family response regulator
MDDDRLARDAWIGEVRPTAVSPSLAPLRVTPPAGLAAPAVSAIEPPGQAPPPNVVTIPPGTKMADIERAAIEAALRETRGNRRRAAEMLGIGERTLYRKIKEYRVPEHEYAFE